jgi:XTP/dITP diphosphohydrolase
VSAPRRTTGAGASGRGAAGLEFVLASLNPDKMRELVELLALPGLRLLALSEFPGARSPEETGATLLENARLKAAAAAALTGLPAIGDDTGLEVDALGGAPGVHASRFSGPGATYASNCALLLERLRGVPRERRTARFRCAMVARWPDGREVVAEGVLEGRITDSPRGEFGFGYDPLFELEDTGLTLAQLPAAEKNTVSHRARAARRLAERLTEG